MDELNNYTIKGYNFTIWFFRLFITILVTILILLFLLRINETVKINEGEIVSVNPQSDYKAPFESQLIKINVKEGQRVMKGDTLLVLQNPELATQQIKIKADITYLQKRVESISMLQQDLMKRKSAISNESFINSEKHLLDMERLSNSIQSLEDQYTLQKDRLSSANERFVGDSILYKKDMLSRSEFNSSKDARLSLKQSISDLENQKMRQLNEKDLATNYLSQAHNSFLLRKVELDENEQALVQTKSEYLNQLLQAGEALKQIETALGKQNLIAVDEGLVNFVFNTKQTSDLISKGELLVSIAPKNLYYYAKAIIPQKDIPYVKAGLDARLKLDAYYHFQYGIMKGKVSYLAERKENEKFYALIQLPRNTSFQLKSGYSIQGEIVLDRMPLYKYFIKKIFKKFDNE